MHYQIIQQQEQLDQLCQQLASGPLFIDTEFVRTRTYYPRLGLFQLYDGQQLALVDPLQIEDLSPLWQALQRPDLPTVLYAASEDLELIHHLSGQMPWLVQDTQIAAAFCGYGLSAGFSAMTQEILQVGLDKGQARTNWLARPLTLQQLQYAAADVFYLPPLHQELMDRLSRLGRLGWFAQECELLTRRKERQNDLELAYQGIGNAWMLSPKELAVLRSLAAWREKEARRRDLALNFVVKELHLFKVAQHRPQSMHELDKLGLLPSEIRTHGKTMLRLVAEALASDPARWPVRIRRLVEYPHYKHELKRLRDKVESVAKAVGVPTELLASKKTIHQYLSWLWQLSDDEREQKVLPLLLTGWRHDLLGALD